MATPANLETLRAEGVDPADVEGVGSNDLFIVARARDEETASKALTVGEAAVLSASPVAEGGPAGTGPALAAGGVAHNRTPTSRWSRCRVTTQRWLPTRRCRRTFTCSCSVTTCRCTRRSPSRTTPSSRGRLVMGPGAGTAMLGGHGSGLRQRRPTWSGGHRRRSRNWCPGGDGPAGPMGVGVSQVIGVGGRDLSSRGRRTDGEGRDRCSARATLRPMSSCWSPSRLRRT